MKLLKDLLYGGRNEYLDIVRLLAALGGIVFLVLEVLKSAGVATFDETAFGVGWGAVLGATTAAIYARNRSDREHQLAGAAEGGQ